MCIHMFMQLGTLWAHISANLQHMNNIEEKEVATKTTMSLLYIYFFE